jgi:GGDEF domain-containing protein
MSRSLSSRSRGFCTSHQPVVRAYAHICLSRELLPALPVRWSEVASRPISRSPGLSADTLMRPRPLWSRDEAYAQAHAALRKAAAVIASALAGAQTGLVVLLDIAGMSAVNSRHGVPTGDRLLPAVEGSLRSELSGTAQVARLAGDQFLVVVPDLVSVEIVVAPILRIIRRTCVRGRWWQSVRATAHVGTAHLARRGQPSYRHLGSGEALAKRHPLVPHAFTGLPWP